MDTAFLIALLIIAVFAGVVWVRETVLNWLRSAGEIDSSEYVEREE